MDVDRRSHRDTSSRIDKRSDRDSPRKHGRHRSRSLSRDRSSQGRYRDKSRDKHTERSEDRGRRREDKDEYGRTKKDRSRSRSRHRHRSRSKSGSRDRKRSSKSSKRERRRRSSSSDSNNSSAASDDKMKSPENKLGSHNQQEELSRGKSDEEMRRRREEKERMKAMETPEQKRARRLAKKEAKANRRKAETWGDDYMGYTNADNPFGDSNLNNTFVWKKKYDKLGVKEISTEDIERENRKKLSEVKVELEKVKKMKLEREKEREEREEERNREQREKELANYEKWKDQEDGFHLRQAKLRSKLRIKDGRAKPIDKLARYFDAHSVKDDEEKEEEEKNRDDEEENYYVGIEMRLPFKTLNGLRASDLEHLLEDVKVYMKLDRPSNLVHWRDMQIIVEDELAKLKNYGTSSSDRREGINSAVAADLESIFKGKTPSQLAAVEAQVEARIRSGDEGTDISYWETLLSKLKARMARARLTEQHEINISRKLEELREAQGLPVPKLEQPGGSGSSRPAIKADGSPSDVRTAVKSEVDDVEQNLRSDEEDKKVLEPQSEASGAVAEAELAGSSSAGSRDEQDLGADYEQEDEYIDPIIISKEVYASGGYSPIYIPLSQLDSSITAIDLEEDSAQLGAKRLALLGKKASSGGRSRAVAGNAAESAFDKEASKGMNKDEATFSVEEVIKQDRSVLSWAEKYRPRKPRYFNRVHTGFEWNKYNQTHYDVDNPPPKIVQGYKFNIFYPDLIEKSKTPQYTITPCADDREFAIIRFKAGPPYEDIAFKIVNREWNFSYKSGYRSQFQNNILQLWFHFKRYRYRR